MGVISLYVSDKEVISNLRGFFDSEEWYSIDFNYWLSCTARRVKDGVMVNVGSRAFLLHEGTGSVIREVK